MPICPAFGRNRSKYQGKQREDSQKERNHELHELHGSRPTPADGTTERGVLLRRTAARGESRGMSTEYPVSSAEH